MRPRDHCKVLQKCGFTKKRRSRGPHDKWVLEGAGGVATLITMVHRHKKDIPLGTLRRIIKTQLHVGPDEYEKLSVCTMSREEYHELLGERYPAK